MLLGVMVSLSEVTLKVILNYIGDYWAVAVILNGISKCC